MPRTHRPDRTGPTDRPDGPAISADVVALLPQPDGAVHLLLSRRQFEPNLGHLALPGVLIVSGETVVEACHRALSTKAGVPTDRVRHLQLAWLADSPVRDARGPTISVAYLAVVDDPEAATRPSNGTLVLPERPTGLPFDHDAIIAGVLDHARDRLWDGDGELARALLGPRFATPDAVALLRAIDPGFNTTNAPRLLASRPCLRKAPPSGPSGRGRPPSTWEFRTS